MFIIACLAHSTTHIVTREARDIKTSSGIDILRWQHRRRDHRERALAHELGIDVRLVNLRVERPEDLPEGLLRRALGDCSSDSGVGKHLSERAVDVLGREERGQERGEDRGLTLFFLREVGPSRFLELGGGVGLVE